MTDSNSWKTFKKPTEQTQEGKKESPRAVVPKQGLNKSYSEVPQNKLNQKPAPEEKKKNQVVGNYVSGIVS